MTGPDIYDYEMNNQCQLIHVLNEAVMLSVHSKNSRVRFDPEKGPMGPDPYLGQTDLESG